MVPRASMPASDLAQRNFTASGPNELWVTGITHIPTWAGFLYLAVVLDAWSRRIVGWAVATHLRTVAGLGPPANGHPQRRPQDVIHHSDHGGQYTSIAFGHRCRKPASAPRWARSVTALTMPCAKASSPRSNANCSTALASTPRPKPVRSSSSSSQAGTILSGVGSWNAHSPGKISLGPYVFTEPRNPTTGWR